MTIRPLRFLAFLVTCHLALVTLPAAHAAAIAFDIPAQPAPDALDLFVKQSGAQVVYLRDDVKDARTNALTGSFEPRAALAVLLKDTGLSSTERKPGQFTVGRAVAKTGSVSGSLRPARGGGSLAGVKMMVVETGAAIRVDKLGGYKFSDLSPGTYTLVASGDGFSRLKITDVVVRAGIDTTLGTQEMPVVLKDGEVQVMKEVIVSAKKDIETLAAVEVSGERVKPFSTANVDLPRTIDDAQPYYIFDARVLSSSGAVNIEDFLKRQLTMNAVGLTASQTGSSETSPGGEKQGNVSSINLRGLGTDKTLILVNGRRLPPRMIALSDYQPDINGIPLSAVERIEVLPLSASGIYGGSAIGGVVNIILKRDYAGGEIRARYENTFDSDAPQRSVALSYGAALGKTRFMLTAQRSDAKPLLMQDRRDVWDRSLAEIMRNNPSLINGGTQPELGIVPNITPATATDASLVLKNGTSLNSRNTYIPVGTSSSTSAAALNVALLANAGSWNTDLPATRQYPTGRVRPLSEEPTTESVQATLRRELFPSLEAFLELNYSSNRSKGFRSLNAYFTVASTAPTNPFKQNVRVAVPDNSDFPPTRTNAVTRSATLGFVAKLPHQWSGELDCTWNRSRYLLSYIDQSPSLATDLNSGALNPFVDTLKYPLHLERYLVSLDYNAASELKDFAARGFGPLVSLPWGTPELAVGLEHRISATPENSGSTVFLLYTYYPRKQIIDSGYAELTVPLLKKDRFPLVYSLEAQASGRQERFDVDTGTSGYYYDRTDLTTRFYSGGLQVNGRPIFGRASYKSSNATVGLKYQPVPSLILRASKSSAFLPPTVGQLTENPAVSNVTTITSDPKDPSVTKTTIVPSISGGNAALKPQNSDSTNAGIVWAPPTGWLKNLRLNFEYYRLEQHDAYAILSLQQIVNNEALFPGRVTRDAAGHVTFVDARYVNLYGRDSKGWDVSLDYNVPTPLGRLSLHGMHSTIAWLKTQYAQTAPSYEGAGYPSESNGAAKHKTSVTLDWSRANWLVAWTTSHVGSYYQTGAPGGPLSVQNANGGVFVNGTLTAQGLFTIPAQMYHDVLVECAFGRAGATDSRLRRIAGDLTVQLGVKNVFNTVPPFDAYYRGNLYLSPYGDLRLRNYWVSVKRAF